MILGNSGSIVVNYDGQKIIEYETQLPDISSDEGGGGYNREEVS